MIAIDEYFKRLQKILFNTEHVYRGVQNAVVSNPTQRQFVS